MGGTVHVFAKPMANKCTTANPLRIVGKNNTLGEHHYSQELATKYNNTHQSLPWPKYDVDDQGKMLGYYSVAFAQNLTATVCLWNEKLLLPLLTIG